MKVNKITYGIAMTDLQSRAATSNGSVIVITRIRRFFIRKAMPIRDMTPMALEAHKMHKTAARSLELTHSAASVKMIG